MAKKDKAEGGEKSEDEKLAEAQAEISRRDGTLPQPQREEEGTPPVPAL